MKSENLVQDFKQILVFRVLKWCPFQFLLLALPGLPSAPLKFCTRFAF